MAYFVGVCTIKRDKQQPFYGICTIKRDKQQPFYGICTIKRDKQQPFCGVCTIKRDKKVPVDALWRRKAGKMLLTGKEKDSLDSPKVFFCQIT